MDPGSDTFSQALEFSINYIIFDLFFLIIIISRKQK